MKTNTVRPRDTQSLGARTLQIHGFELGPKQFEIRGFMRILTKTQRISKILRIFFRNQKPRNSRPYCNLNLEGEIIFFMIS